MKEQLLRALLTRGLRALEADFAKSLALATPEMGPAIQERAQLLDHLRGGLGLSPPPPLGIENSATEIVQLESQRDAFLKDTQWELPRMTHTIGRTDHLLELCWYEPAPQGPSHRRRAIGQGRTYHEALRRALSQVPQ